MAEQDDGFFNNFDLTAKTGAAPVAMPKPLTDDGFFSNFDLTAGTKSTEPATSLPGAFLRSAIGSAAPSIGSLPVIARGAQAGAVLGEAIFPAGGGLVGGFAGGVAGAYFGSEGISAAQSWLLSKVPKLRDFLGQSEEQKRLDQQEHEYGSFLGGIAPFAITMSPAAVGRKTLAPDATTWQRLAADPRTARLFSGAIMGGMQLGQEVTSEDKVNWNHVAIATGFGLIFNKPNRLGERISEFPARPAHLRPLQGPTEADLTGHYEGLSGWDVDPTPAMVAEEGLAGAGDTHETFLGYEAKNPTAEIAAIRNAGTERDTIGPVRSPDLENTARQMEPELFANFDAAQIRLAVARNRMAEINEPAPGRIEALQSERDALEAAEKAEVDKHKGWRGSPERRRLGAQVREKTAEINLLGERAAAFREGRAIDTPDIIAARQEIVAADLALRDIYPQVHAAYRSAADYTGAPVVAPPAEVAAPPAEPAPEHPPITEPAATPAATAVAPAEAAAPAPVTAPSEEQAAIAKTAYGRMVKAGEPPERAEWLSKLSALATSVRASRFGGALGNAAELYEREGEKYRVFEENGRSFEVTPPPAQPDAPLPTNRAELNAFLAAGGDIKAAPKGAPGPPREPLVTPPPGPPEHATHPYFVLNRDGTLTNEQTREAVPGSPKFKNDKQVEDWLKEKGIKYSGLQVYPVEKALRVKTRGVEAYATIVAQHEKVGMVDNADAFKAAAKKRAERGGGTVQLVTAAEERARQGVTVKEENEEYAAASKRFDQYLTENKLAGDAELERLRPLIVERMYQGFDPVDAIDLATAKDALEQNLIDDPEARQAAEDFAAMEEGHGFLSEVPPAAGGGTTEAGQKGQGERAEGVGAAGEPAREVGTEQDVDEFFQAVKGQKLGGIRLEANGLATILRDTRNADASTIIHELGHHWLTTLIRDSLHPLAPQQIRDDAAAAVRFLGLKSADELDARTKGGELTQKAIKANERWATGVEQYFYEGRAPAPELIPLFDRFKNWMRNVYNSIKDIVTAKGEHYPINDAFRGIMDRMLTMPDETVIMPDRPRGPTITDYHELDAKHTEPPEAEPALDRVVAEGKRYVEEQPPEVQAGIEAKARAAGIGGEEGAKPAGEGGGGPGGRGEVVGDRGTAEPNVPGGGGREKHGTIVEGGTPARPESSTVPGAGGAAEREHPLAPGPAPDSLPRGDGKYVDNAGNIRKELVTNKQAVGDALTESAERNNDFEDAQGAPAGKGLLWQLSSELGLDPSKIDNSVLEKHLDFLVGGMKDMAKKVLAARRLLKQSATTVSDLAKKAAASFDANSAFQDDDALEFALAVTQHDMIQSAVSGATASWGRTGLAFRDISVGWDEKVPADQLLRDKTGRTLFQIKQLAKLMAQYEDAGQISYLVRESGKPTAARMLPEYWINGLISGLQTHMTYTVGNTILALEKVGPETAAAAAIGALRKSMGREGETVRLGEVAAGLRGIKAGFWPAVHSALQAIEKGTTTLLPGEDVSQTLRFQAPLAGAGKPGVLNEAAQFSDVMEKAFGIVRGIREGVVAGAALQRAGGVPGAPLYGWEYSPLGAIPNFQYRGGTVLPIGDIVRAPSRMIAAIHSFFRPINYSIEIHQRAYRDAANQNLTGANFDSEVASGIRSPSLENQQAAHNMSNELTLMGAGGEITKKLSALINTEFLGQKDAAGKAIPGTGIPFLKFIDPFVHISSNIINQSIVQRTPIGILSTAVRNDLLGRNGPIRADTAAAKMLVGTALSILFGSLAAEGYVTGSEPSNREDAALWRQVYQAHSVRIGDTWYAMNRLGPMGMLLSTAADMYQVAHLADEGDMAKAAAALQHAIAQNILDESFMRGPSDLIKATEEPGRYGAAYVRTFLSSFVPFSVGMSQMARAADPYTRQARSITDAMVAKVPFLSQSLLPRRDVWGEPMPSRYGLGGNVTAIWEQERNDDPVNKALLAHSIHVAAVEHKIRNIELTPEQYDDWSRLAGRLAKQSMDRLVRSPSYQQWPPGVQHDMLTENLRQSRNTAQNMMFMKYPSLLVDARAAKMAKRSAVQ